MTDLNDKVDLVLYKMAPDTAYPRCGECKSSCTALSKEGGNNWWVEHMRESHPQLIAAIIYGISL